MEEHDLILRLAEALAGQLRSEIPLSVDLWDIATIAAYVKRDPQVVRERLACVPSFPRDPSANENRTDSTLIYRRRSHQMGNQPSGKAVACQLLKVSQESDNFSKC